MPTRPFKTKCPVDLPASDSIDRPMTLSEHIMSSNPHPNMPISGGGEFSEDFANHIASRYIDNAGNVSNSPHLDTLGNQLFAGRTHNHDNLYSQLGHRHSDLDTTILSIQDKISLIENNVSGGQVYVLDQPESVDTVAENGKLTDRYYDLDKQINGGRYLFIGDVEKYNKYSVEDGTISEVAVPINNTPSDVTYPFVLETYPGCVRKSESSEDGNPLSSVYRIYQKITDHSGNIWSRFGLADNNGSGRIESRAVVNKITLTLPQVIDPSIVSEDDEYYDSKMNSIDYISSNGLSGEYTYNAMSKTFLKNTDPSITAVLNFDENVWKLNIKIYDTVVLSSVVNINKSEAEVESALSDNTALWDIISAAMSDLTWATRDGNEIINSVFDVENISEYNYVTREVTMYYEASEYAYSNWVKVASV